MKKLCHYYISIHTNFLQNRSINECARFWHKSGLKWPWMTFDVILPFINYMCLYTFGLLKRLGVKQKIYHRKRWLYDLMRPSRTFEVILHWMKNLCLYNVSIHIFFSSQIYPRKRWYCNLMSFIKIG